MQVIITAYDGGKKLEKRLAVRPRHLEGVAKLSSHIVCAGGILDEAGKPKGSVLVMEFESRSELDRYLSEEPYAVEQVWEKIVVEPVNVVYLGGEKVGK